ncbi:MAG TPA: glycosyltransferase family 4 protein [Intrasporangiaceae bacterium]|nr:glycosyltransferase family 4 protein [Intrasporangiaceae bacterium]
MTPRPSVPDLWARLVPAAAGPGDEPWEFVLPGAPRPVLAVRPSVLVSAPKADHLLPLAPMLRLLGVTGWPLQLSHRDGTLPAALAPFAGPHLYPVEPDGATIVVEFRRRGRFAGRLGRGRWHRAGVAAAATAVFAEAATRPALRGSDVDAVLDAAESMTPGAVPPAGWAMVLQRLLPWVDRGQLARFTAAAQRCRIDPLAIGAQAAVELERQPDSTDWIQPAQDLAAASLSGAERLLQQGQRRAAAVVAAGGLRVLFGRTRHVHAASSPLIEAPESFLVPLHAAAATLLPAPGAPDSPIVQSSGSGVVILPGAYPSFADGLVRALGDEVNLLDLSSLEPRFANTEMEPRTLAELFALDRGSGVMSPAATALAAALAQAAVVVADWADKGAALASRLLRPGQRLVVRINGVDHLSAWLHLIRWARVDDVIFVSEHVRRAVLAAGLPGFAGVRQHVIPHPLTVGPPIPKTADAGHTLGLIGWAQQVKDPVFALDILGLLRAADPRWRLLLIGPDLADATATDERFHRQVRQRMAAPDVHGAVETTGALPHDDVVELLPRIGYGLSTSRRESLHVGALEMVASGAVPIVRDWPLYAPLQGAATVFGAENVVTTPAAAADLIQRLDADPAMRTARVELAMRSVLERHAPDRVAAELATVVLGAGASAGMA